jgi:hypothetical protein
VSNILAVTYDNVATITPSDTVADPAGPFAGLLAATAGTVKFTAVGGGTANTTVVAGQVLHIATQRVWSAGTAATMFGLLAPPYKKPVGA